MKNLMDTKPTELLNKDTGNKETYLIESSTNKYGTQDPNLVCYELHNKTNEDITLYDQIKLGNIIVCKANGFVFMPHNYFIATVPSGNQEITVVKNYGDMMFKGNKNPSRPDVKSKTLYPKI